MLAQFYIHRTEDVFYICDTGLPLQLMDWLAYVTYCDLTDDKGGNPASKTRFIAHWHSAKNSMFNREINRRLRL